MQSQDNSVTKNYKRGFWALIVTQFQGAFSDNLFRFFIIFYLVNLYRGMPDDPASLDRAEQLVPAIALALFTVPFLLIPGYAAALSDRFSKQQITLWTKYLEVAIMAFGLVAFLLVSPALIWITLFLMATQSAFFSPAKYGILPEMLPENRLSWGNGIIQMTTFVAIIAGTALAGPLSDFARARDVYFLGSVALIGLALAGTVSARLVTRTPPADPTVRVPVNPWAGLGRYYRIFWNDRWLFLTMVGLAFFWFAGALVQQNIVAFGQISLDLAGGRSFAPFGLEFSLGQDTLVSLLAAGLALGIGLGALASGYLSRGRIEVGLVPLGALGIAAVSLLLALPAWGYGGALGLLFLVGFCAGLYDVPLAAALQSRSPRNVKGGMIASSNVVTFLAMLAASGIYYGFGYFEVTPRQVFFVLAIMTLAVGAYICYLLPQALLRFGLWVAMNTVYRVRTLNKEHVPDTGGALLVANHTSFIDALVLTASIDRPIRFIIHEDVFNLRWVRPFARMMDCIPVSSKQGPRELLTSMKTASNAIRQGDLVCIFAEGQISRSGQLLPFRKGFELIVRDTDAPIIPVHLDRLWGSIFSFAGEKFFWKVPRKIPYPITVNYGAPHPPDTTPFELYQAIEQLGADAYMLRKDDEPLLHRAFVKAARWNLRRLAMADQRSGEVNYFKALVGSVVLARKLSALLDKQPMVGLLVPPSVGGALCNIALQYMGRVPVNLNYTASADGMASAAKQCDITQVVTSRAFLEKLPLEVPGEPIYLEDVMKSVTGGDRIKAMLLALSCPVRWLERLLGGPKERSPDDMATIIFSSGSEAEPKGVMLTHFNISSNVASVMQVFAFDKRRDSIMGFLPFFHSFGYMATIWLPLTQGFPVVYHPSPLEVKVIGELIHKYKVSFMVATPTFLQGFVRRCLPEELSSLRFCITGAEKLTERVREAFLNKFGLEPLEGYGTTECSPVVSVNIPDFRKPGFYQKGNKRGTIGRPIPGVCVRVCDPDTGELLGQDQPGMLQVKGPNIMKGYLNKPEKTAEVLQDGWYSTGDIAKIDEEGFITITDRLSRFSKIAGEMVPHNKVEEVLHTMLGLTEQSFAVCGVPDEQKGERLVVLHTLENGQLEGELFPKLDQSGLPKLWQPKATSFYQIEEIPVLGTGKMDLKKIKQLAQALDLGG